jgi:hypothetical protein
MMKKDNAQKKAIKIMQIVDMKDLSYPEAGAWMVVGWPSDRPRVDAAQARGEPSRRLKKTACCAPAYYLVNRNQ